MESLKNEVLALQKEMAIVKDLESRKIGTKNSLRPSSRPG